MEDLTSSDENVTRRSRAGQGIHHILREATLLAEPCASPGAWARQGRDTPGPGHAGGWMRREPGQTRAGMGRGQGEPGSGQAGAWKRRGRDAPGSSGRGRRTLPLLGNRLAPGPSPSYPHPRSAARSHWLSPRGARLPLGVRRPCRVPIGAPPSAHAASLSHAIPPARSARRAPGGRSEERL